MDMEMRDFQFARRLGRLACSLATPPINGRVDGANDHMFYYRDTTLPVADPKSGRPV